MLIDLASVTGILKGHYANACAFEGERFDLAMIERGSLEWSSRC